MKATIKIGVVLCIGCLLVSCKPTTIKGKAINPINGKGIEGVAISAQTSTWELPGGAKTKEKVVSDANGNFVLQYKGECQINVSVGADYYPIGWHVNGNTTKGINPERGEATHADYYAVPYGKLNMHIQNINCEGVTDTMWYKMRSIFRDDFVPGWTQSHPFTGCTKFTANGYDKEVMGKQIIKMKIKRTSGVMIKYDTVFVKENGITHFDLLY